MKVGAQPHGIVDIADDLAQGKPGCSTCRLAGLVCAGYAKSIVFSTDDGNGNKKYRRPLFTDRERQSMSESLMAQVSTKTAHALIAEIDAEWEANSVSHEEQIDVQRGPFGAFNVLSLPLEHADSPDVTDFIDNFLANFDDFARPDYSQERLITNHDSSWLEDSEEDEIANFFGMQNVPLRPETILFPNLPFSTQNHVYNPRHSFSTALTQGYSPNNASAISVPRELRNVDMMQDVPLLLKYYADVIISLLSPFKHGKTPWHVLFLPLMKTTLAGITIREVQDDASLSALYATLSLSALQLHSQSHDPKYSEQASFFKRLALDHIQGVHARAYEKPKVFKYKVVVIALLAVAQLSSAEGLWEQTERCLLETEKFIRLRGLRKPHKSRKVRLLHHCYAYMRMFHETFSFTSTSSDQRLLLCRMVEGNGELILGQDDPSFRLTPWENLNEKLREVKSREEGENDLHMARPGLWISTLYPEIWGIPESYMMLLSQTIRLGNEKDLAESAVGAGAISLREFLQRAKALEKCIIDWEGPAQNSVSTGAPETQQHLANIDWVSFNSGMRALHHGLLIYFYRRVHDVDANVLQSEVVRVRDSLFACRQHMQSGSKYLAGLVWPAFVAACEAIDTELQSSFLEWFELCAQHNGQSSLTRMQEFVKTLWVRRQHSENASLTWLQLIKSKSLEL